MRFHPEHYRYSCLAPYQTAYAEATTRTVNGQQCRTAYPNNIITSPLSPVATAISAYIP
ncbi:hypothetical protein HDF12_002150 [Edaphobacter lichenicola]|uniref:Uncharacterized protein n=1 Tax=Tunturiibacter lichenicola TaxID=2051959 RepID=A0A7Y9NMZ1_9BACT|nr:hypothetical protein [Edaphobacter lichenicola]